MNRINSRRRAGLVGVVLVVVLALIALMTVALVRLGTARQRAARDDERRAQAEWLAESGVDRAAARLAADADYQGETWRIPAAEIGGPWDGSVRIQVEPADGRRLVRVRADYPAGVDNPMRRGRQATLPVPRQQSPTQAQGG